jgi:hypothetical protein
MTDAIAATSRSSISKSIPDGFGGNFGKGGARFLLGMTLLSLAIMYLRTRAKKDEVGGGQAMAQRKGMTPTRTPSKRTDTGTSKTANGSAIPIAMAARLDFNGHTPLGPASEAATHAQIELRAYELFLARGVTNNDDLADWFEAEKQLHS